MSASFEIRSSSGAYGISIGTGLIGEMFTGVRGAIIICDQYFESSLKSRGIPIVAVEATESAKSLDRMSQIIIQLREAGANRDSTLVAVGGGVIQDIATFCASIFMRGIPWLYAPTTLLGMVDSCIGGKSSINVGNYKNIVGNFFPPQTIVIDASFINSLSAEKRIAGLCEAVKICFARGDEAFNRYLVLSPAVEMPIEKFSEVIELSLRAKKWFIEIDEFDRNERLLLNFGHTFGHAIEGATHFAVTHGVAVGLGMLAAADFAARQGIAAAPAARTERLIRHVSELLAGVAGLDKALSSATIDAALDRFSSDKKHGKDFFTAIVPNGNGVLERMRLPRDDVSRRKIGAAFGSVFSRWSGQAA